MRDLRTSSAPAGNRLARAFELAGLTQVDCVRRTKFTRQYVSDMTRGRFQNVSLDNARAFADYFGCRIEDLFPAPEEPAAAQPILPFVPKAVAR